MGDNTSPTWDGFGAYLRTQRQLARLTLRQMAALTDISNPYLSQIERGLHKPSLTVLKSIADALNVSVDALLEQSGVVGSTDAGGDAVSTETAIRNDPRLSSTQKAALLAVYRSMVADTGADATAGAGTPAPATAAPQAAPGAPARRPAPKRARQSDKSGTGDTAAADPA
jgi:transcriptional regulator with XRE-family HTH domain